MVSDDYIFGLEKRIRFLEENQIKKSKIRSGLSVDDLVKKVFKAKEKGISPSIINRQLNGAAFQKRIEETKEISLVTIHRETAGRPVFRYVHSDYLK
jgi:hypothetical protein